MTPDIVVDIGNSRMKWGRVAEGKVVEMVSLPHDDALSWKRQIEWWSGRDNCWAIASVAPKPLLRFSEWLDAGHFENIILDNQFVLRSSAKLGFTTTVKQIDRIGIDRLLCSIAAFHHSNRRSTSIAISVGTAMTVDFVKEDGIHVGGVILPGPHLMAKSLHDYTAKLPIVEIDPVVPVRIWGTNTKDCIDLGIASAILGAADQLVWDWFEFAKSPPSIYVTGGDAGYFRNFVFTADVQQLVIDPFLILEGIRLAAEQLP